MHPTKTPQKWFRTIRTMGVLIASKTNNQPCNIQSFKGNNLFSVCPAAHYMDITTITCTKCSAGTYNENENQKTGCSQCEAGKFSADGSESCSVCEAGTYSNLGSATCSECEAGKFSAVGSAGCYECEAGKFSVAGSASCSECGAGTILNSHKTGCGQSC